MVVEALTHAMPNECVREVALWDCLNVPGPFANKEEVIAHAQRLSGFARTLFIFQLYAQSMEMAGDATVQILNGHWFKYAVSEMGYGVSEMAVLGAARGFAPVDHTFFLAIDPSEAWNRRRRASLYEQGLITGADRDWLTVQERFVVFQRHLGRHWQQMMNSYGNWTTLDTSFNKQSRCNRIVSDVLAMYQAIAA